MPEEGFLRRWARVKASGGEAVAEAPALPAAPAAPMPVAEPVPAAAAVAAPTLEDVARLTADSDFSVFVGQGVDKAVQRLALKKLFADPHFNVLDRLDMYMDDYNKLDPVSPAMLASLEHARGVLRRPEEVQAELARLRAADMPADVPGDIVADPAATEPAIAGLERGEADPAEPAHALPLDSASTAPEPGQDAADSIVHDSRSCAILVAPASPDAALDRDTIAPQPARAHNAEARA